MSSNEISLEQLRRLISFNGGGCFNLFLGAGISRDAPTHGPIWSEMQVELLQAIFDRMEAEGWPASSNFPIHREKTRELKVRPELFWREMMEVAGENFVWKALDAVETGAPNENHARIATLLETGRCRWAVTTNFDEHIEPFLSDDVSVFIPMDVIKFSSSDSSAYVKLHGSIGSKSTLAYTLEHYDTLKQRHEVILDSILSSYPLVIAGYSGYDTDILPVLRSLVNRIPWMVVIRHPGSPQDQPILQIAAESSRSYILESTCPQTLQILTEGLNNPYLELPSAPIRDKASCYADAAGEVGIHLCPMILVIAFRLSGSWGLVHQYAWLTHDAIMDTRYQTLISTKEYQHIHQMLALSLKLAGDSAGAQIMLEEANNSLGKCETASLDDLFRSLFYEAVARDAPTQADGNSDITPMRNTTPDRTPSEVLEFQLAMSKTLAIPNRMDVFELYWMIGVTKRREGQRSCAVEAFNEALPYVLDSAVTYMKKGHFLLDFGVAVFEHGAELQDNKLAEQAHTILLCCEKCTEVSGDYTTNAKSNLMLAKLYLGGDSFSEAWNRIRLARLAVCKTEDTALSKRIEEVARVLGDIEMRVGGGPQK